MMIAKETLPALPDMREITRLCEADEIGILLKKIQGVLNQDLRQFSAWTEENNFILRQISQADFQELSQLHKRLNDIEIDRFLLTNSVSALHCNCTHYRDVIATRTIDLVATEMRVTGRKSPNLPYALLSMGSDGRNEQTLITDQDYLIVYGDGGGEEADLYFKDFSILLVDRLEEVGFKKCTGDIMPSNPTWRGSYAQWRKRLLSIVRYEFEDYAKNMMDLIVLSDARYVAGGRELAEKLASMIREMERDYFQVLWGMAKAATEMKLALGFLKRLWTESSGEHKGEFNLKLLAWAPLVMNVRILAINQGIPATSTVDRIKMLEKEGSFSAGFSNELQFAYHILTKHRILLQIKVLKGIEKDPYHLNPYQLGSGEVEKIHHAILKIEELQKIIHSNFSIV
ncbi:MAG: nucleotidyltransferase [Geobacteraceae bacterium GWB2_52_12]|nr:MAG: nucleotidyltransferase [Geobacteraceae bacterium GWB2_52_12]